MISKCRKSDHYAEFIGGSWRLFLFQADIDEKRGEQKNVNGIHPGAHRMLR